jgi:hypothetical protein
MFRKIFDPTDCFVEAETKSGFCFSNEDSGEIEDVTIRVVSATSVELARLHVLRIPSSYKDSASTAISPFYSMGTIMTSYSRDLAFVAEQMDLNRNYPACYASKQLKYSDLYLVLSFAVSPMFKDCGIEEWLYANVPLILRKLCREEEPVCAFLFPEDETASIDPSRDAMKEAGWEAVKPNARTWYLM